MELTFRVAENDAEKEALSEKLGNSAKGKAVFKYPDMTKTMGTFRLEVSAGLFKPGEI